MLPENYCLLYSPSLAEEDCSRDPLDTKICECSSHDPTMCGICLDFIHAHSNAGA